MNRVIIAGSRNLNPTNDQLTKILLAFNIKPTTILCGDARGVDFSGACWARENNVPVEHYPADWGYFGKRAGYIRNEQMAQYASALPDTVQSLLIAYWDGKSAGTKSMIDLARRHNIPIHIIHI